MGSNSRTLKETRITNSQLSYTNLSKAVLKFEEKGFLYFLLFIFLLNFLVFLIFFFLILHSDSEELYE